MLSKTADKHPGYGLLDGVYGRQAWRPLALRAAGSVLSAISHRGKRLDRRRAQLMGWHEKLARRGQPLIGWLPLRTEEFGVSVQLEERPPRALKNAPASELALTSPSVTIPRGDRGIATPAPIQNPPLAALSPTLIDDPESPPGSPRHRTVLWSTGTDAAASPPRKAGSLPEFSKSAARPMDLMVPAAAPAGPRTLQGKPDSPRVAMKSSTVGAAEKRLAPAVGRPMTITAPKPQGVPPFVRPAMRLAALQPIGRVTDSARRNEPAFSAVSNFWLIATRAKDLPGSQSWRNGTPLAFQQRLVPRVSPSPRREVHGGFPADQPTGVHPGDDMFGESRVISVREFSAEGANLLSRSPASGVGVSSQAYSAWPNQPGTAEISGVIERLINRTILPAPLPGIQVRGLPPDMPGLSLQPARATEEARPAVEGAKPPAPSPALPPPAPPPLDINSLADKVYQTLVRRQQFEQERRGLY